MYTKPLKNKKNIVILGAGFCGIQVAKNLAHKLRFQKEYQIILVDRRDNHTYHADLYEISNAYTPRISNGCLRMLKESVCIPLKKIFAGLPILFLKDEVEQIDYPSKKVVLKGWGNLAFEYLVVALGSVTNFYNIPGLEEHAYPLKTVGDALAIRCHFEDVLKNRRERKERKKLHIVVGGGGFTGVEYACELTGFLQKLTKKYAFSLSDVDIKIVQASEEFIGLGKAVSDIVIKRFKALGIRPLTGAKIASYDGKRLTLCSKTGVCKRSVLADVVIWTGGIKPNPLLNNFPILDKSGSLEVFPTLESPHYPKVYVGGDNAAFFDPVHHQMLPKLAQYAVKQGPVIAYNIWADMVGKKQKVYKPFFKGFIVPLGKKYFVYHKGWLTFAGIIPYIIKKFVDIRYFTNLLAPFSALKKWWHSENIFVQND